MRPLADPARIAALMRALGRAAREPARVYFTGGATALLLGWRAATVDVDLRIEPDTGALLRELPRLKEELAINLELASPCDFLPELPGWRERSPFVAREGSLDFFHFDLYAQALAKIERGHALDRRDVAELLRRGLVEPARLRELHGRIEPELYRFPAIDPGGLRRRLDEALAPGGGVTG